MQGKANNDCTGFTYQTIQSQTVGASIGSNDKYCK
jgi:hypothetical protein